MLLDHHSDINLRIHKARKFIEENLAENISLAQLAEMANYSPFHFQRIFKSVVGETPKQYVKRLRLEGAAHEIYLNPAISIWDISLRFGFTSLPAFSRAFKNYYEVSPDEFRRSREEEKLDIKKKRTKAYLPYPIHPDSFLSQSVNEEEELEVEVVHLPLEKLIYIPITMSDISAFTGSYKKLKTWAEAQGLMRPHTKTYGLMLDYPLFTALDKCRYYTCMTVDSQPKVNGGIHYMERAGGIYASFKVSGGINELVKTATRFASQWLHYSGYTIRHVPAILSPDQDPLSVHPHENSYQVYFGLEKSG